MKENENLAGWQYIWWLFTIFGLPITIPWFIYHFSSAMTLKNRKSALQGKVVLITGASSGLGEALAHVFYSCGCKLILVARRKQELERVKSSLVKSHLTVQTYVPVVFPLDLSEINNITSEVNNVLKIYNKIDILVNNAGVSYRGEVADTKMDVDIKVMLINYFAQIALTKAILPSMIRQKSGHIVCISSVQGKIAIPFRSAYTASKHALQAWCDSARAELSMNNIKITVVNPGYIKTELSLNAVTASGGKYGIMDETTKSGYSPKYVAELVLKATLRNSKEVTITNFVQKIAIFLRANIPGLYFKIMELRTKKFMKKNNL